MWITAFKCLQNEIILFISNLIKIIGKQLLADFRMKPAHFPPALSQLCMHTTCPVCFQHSQNRDASKQMHVTRQMQGNTTIGTHLMQYRTFCFNWDRSYQFHTAIHHNASIGLPHTVTSFCYTSHSYQGYTCQCSARFSLKALIQLLRSQFYR
jgi:hypothetical protein